MTTSRLWVHQLFLFGGVGSFPLLRPLRPLSRLLSSTQVSSFDHLWKPDASVFVESPQNARIKAVRLLHSSNGRKKSGLVLLEGHRLCCDALEDALDTTCSSSSSSIKLPDTVFVSTSAFEAPEGPRLLELLQKLPHDRVVTTTPEVLSSVSTTETPQGVCLALPRPSLLWDHRARLVLVLDGLRDPGNMGTLIRSAAASGCGGVLLLKGCVDPWSPKALRSSMGASFRVPIAQATSWQHALDEFLQPTATQAAAVEPLTLFAADASAFTAYHEVSWDSGRNALIVGSEAQGLSQQVREAVEKGAVELVSIPLATEPHTLGRHDGSSSSSQPRPGHQRSAVESLNAAVAGTIVLCEAHRQILREPSP